MGGTNTRLGLYTPERGPRDPVAEIELPSADFDGLEPIVRRLLDQVGGPAATRSSHGACFGVAGPVVDGQVDVTHLPWSIDAEKLRQALGLARVTLLNDLEAVAHALPHLRPDELHTLRSGRPAEHGTLAVIAPGTGLGEAFAVWNGHGYLACPSEGGHAAFAPGDELEAELLAWLRHGEGAAAGPVECDALCSGRGIPRIYDFLRQLEPAAEPTAFTARLAAAPDRAPLIVSAALGDPAGHPLCAHVLEIFVGILAGEARNLALKVLPLGGLYLGGGIAPRILARLGEGRFARAFDNGGQSRNLLAAIPLRVILAGAGLLGAAIHGLAELDREQPKEG